MNRLVIGLLSGVAGLALVSGAQAADLILEGPAAGVVEVASGDWDGVYVGVFGGGVWATFNDDGSEEEADGWLLGVNAGANFSLSDGIVAGVVGDIAWTDASSDVEPISMNWVGSLRGRLGFDGGAFLPYVTAGLAFANADISGNNATHVGWTAGAGIEFAATDSLSVDLLYRYTDFGSADYVFDDIGLTAHQVTVGLNWRF